MTTELTCLVANALFGVFLVVLEITAKTRIAGPAWNAGNRETSPPFPAWVERASRAIGNHKENFPVFLTAVVVAHLSHHTDRATEIASIVYVVARALHAALYIAGVHRLRSLAFVTGFIATLVIFSRLFS